MVVVIQFKYEVIVLASTEIASVDIAMGIPYTFIKLKHFVRRFRQSPLDSHYKCPGPIFCPLLGAISVHAQPITGQVTEVTCPVIGRAQPELTPSKRQKMGPVMQSYDAYFVIRLSKRINKQ